MCSNITYYNMPIWVHILWWRHWAHEILNYSETKRMRTSKPKPPIGTDWQRFGTLSGTFNWPITDHEQFSKDEFLNTCKSLWIGWILGVWGFLTPPNRSQICIDQFVELQKTLQMMSNKSQFQEIVFSEIDFEIVCVGGHRRSKF